MDRRMWRVRAKARLRKMNCLLFSLIALEVSIAVLVMGMFMSFVGTRDALVFVATVLLLAVIIGKLQKRMFVPEMHGDFVSEEAFRHLHTIKRFARMIRQRKPELRFRLDYEGVRVKKNEQRNGFVLVIGDTWNRRLSAAELRSILGHEFGHMRWDDIFLGSTIYLFSFFTLSFSLLLVSVLFFAGSIGSVWPAYLWSFLISVLEILGIFVLGAVYERWIDYVMESRADAFGALLSGNTHTLDRVLVKLYPEWGAPTSARSFFTDPGSWIMCSRVEAIRSIFRE